jgi:hypothetical protein
MESWPRLLREVRLYVAVSGAATASTGYSPFSANLPMSLTDSDRTELSPSVISLVKDGMAILSAS